MVFLWFSYGFHHDVSLPSAKSAALRAVDVIQETAQVAAEQPEITALEDVNRTGGKPLL